MWMWEIKLKANKLANWPNFRSFTKIDCTAPTTHSPTLMAFLGIKMINLHSRAPSTPPGILPDKTLTRSLANVAVIESVLQCQRNTFLAGYFEWIFSFSFVLLIFSTSEKYYITLAPDLSGIALHMIICLVFSKLLLPSTECFYILIHIMNNISSLVLL